MCDIEVIITDAQYRTLKQAQVQLQKLKTKLGSLENDIWKYQRQIKQKNEVIDINKTQIKELSKNSINLAKKVLASEDLLANQEDKWLSRQRALLDKLMGAIKIKEQAEEGWKREKNTLKVQEQKYQDSLHKIGQLAKENKQRQNKWQKKNKNLEKQIAELESKIGQTKQKYDEQMSILHKEIKQLSSRLSEALEDKQIFGLKVTEKQLLLAQVQLEIQELKKINTMINEQIEKMNIRNQEIKQEHQLELKIIKQKNNSKIKHIQSILKRMMIELNKVKNQSKEVSTIFKNMKNDYLFGLYNFNSDFIKLSGKINLQIEQQSKNIASFKESILKLDIQSAQNSKLVVQSQRYEEQILELKNQIQNSEEKQNKLSRSNFDLVIKIKELEQKLQEANHMSIKIQTEKQELRQKIKYLNHELQVYEERFYRQQSSKSVQMTTQVIQLQQQALYAANKCAQGGMQFKEDVDILWHSIERFLSDKKQELQQMEELHDISGQILREQFKLMIQRFTYNFEHKYMPSIVK